MNNNEERSIVQDYMNGESLAIIQKKYHHDYYTTVAVLNKYNIPHNRQAKKEAKKKAFLEKKDEVISYYNEGNGLTKCARKFGVYTRDIKKILQGNNIHIRSFQENIDNKEKDIDFFKKQSHDMAWLVGFLAADGCISKNTNRITIQLAKKDEEILEKIRTLIGIDNKISSYTTNTGYDVVTYGWGCEEHKKDLASYNVIPHKTFALTPPYTLEKQYRIDYIRGYFDGDGSINLIKNSNGRGNGNLRWQVCSATKCILEFIRDELESLGVPPVNIRQEFRTNEPLYVLSYSSRATRMIYDVLYNDSEMFLARKREHYEEILDKVDVL